MRVTIALLLPAIVMANQTISLIISAKDFASGTLQKIGASLAGLSKQSGASGIGAGLTETFSAIQKSSDGFLDSMTMSVVKANLIGTAFGYAGSAIGTARSELEKMSSIQLQTLASANSLTQVGKISMGQSNDLLDSMTKELAQKASAWAGSTDDYLAVLRMVQPDIAKGSKINGKLMVDDFKKNAVGIAGDYAAIGAASGSSSQETGLFLKRLLNGASMNELNNLSFGMNNPIVTQNINKEMIKLGVTSMEQLSQSQRLAVIAAAGKAGNSEQMQKAASNTIDGLLQSFKDKIFSPYAGYFGGVFRKLDGVPGQSATVAEAFNKVLQKLIGEGGLFDTLTKTLGKIGLGKLDPMVMLRDSLDNFSNWIDGVNKTFQGINKQLEAGATVGDLLKGSIASFSSTFSQAFTGIGERAAKWLNGAVDGLIKGAGNIDYGAILGTIGNGIMAVLKEVWGFLSNLDPKVYMAGAAILLAGAIGVAVIGAVGALVATVGAAIVGLGAPMVLLIGAWGLSMVGTFQYMMTNWDKITNWVTTKIDEVGKFLAESWDKIKQAIGNQVNKVVPGGTGTTDFAGAALNAIAPVITPFAGLIPGHFDGGFLGAIGREERNSTGTPVIANSSEAILTPGQLQNMVAGIYASGQGSGGRAVHLSISPGAIVVQGANDPEETARQTLQQLEEWLSQYQMAFIG